jgi:hypothetical protein
MVDRDVAAELDAARETALRSFESLWPAFAVRIG